MSWQFTDIILKWCVWVQWLHGRRWLCRICVARTCWTRCECPLWIETTANRTKILKHSMDPTADVWCNDSLCVVSWIRWKWIVCKHCAATAARRYTITSWICVRIKHFGEMCTCAVWTLHATSTTEIAILEHVTVLWIWFRNWNENREKIANF